MGLSFIREIPTRSGPATRLAGPEARTTRPRIALISPWYPEPVDNGSKVRLRLLIDTFAADYDVLLITLLSRADLDAGQFPTVPGVVRAVRLPLPDFQARSLRGVAAGLHPYPRSFAATWDQQTAEAIRRQIRDADVDLVIGTDLRVLRYLLAIDSGIPIVLDEANVSPFVQSGPDRRRPAIRASLRARKYQRLLHSGRKLDAVVAPSRAEADAFRTLLASAPVHIIGNGVRSIPDRPWTPPGTTNLLYTGSVTYGPNFEAVSWYATLILPLLWTQVAAPILHITGTLPDFIPDVLKQPSFRLTGRLDDLDGIYRTSAVFVAPILSGTGTRIKILEAMAIGMPVVTTSKGCEGIPLVAGEHALVADTPEAFTLAILRVLNDPSYAAELGRRGRAFVARHGTWQASAERFLGLVAGLLNDAR